MIFFTDGTLQPSKAGLRMTLELAPGWTSELERGPDWLFVRLHAPHGGDPREAEIADRLWKLLEQQFSRRIVLELDDLPVLRSALIGEIVRLHKRVAAQGGLMRICGLSDANQEVLRTCRLDSRFPQYRNREEAVMGHRPFKPR